MKKALPTFAVALALLFCAIGSADPDVAAQRPRLELDFTGVDTLELAIDGMSEIELSNKDAPGLIHSWSLDAAPRVERTGSQLRISDGAEKGYRHFELRVPTTVRRFIVDGAEFSTRVPLAAIEIDTTGYVTWEGDVRTLRIRDLSKPTPKCGCSGAGATVSINKGKIEQLRIESPRGKAEISDIDTIIEATLVLGPKAKFSVGGRRGLAALRLEDMPGVGSAETGPEEEKEAAARVD